MNISREIFYSIIVWAEKLNTVCKDSHVSKINVSSNHDPVDHVEIQTGSIFYKDINRKNAFLKIAPPKNAKK